MSTTTGRPQGVALERIIEHFTAVIDLVHRDPSYLDPDRAPDVELRQQRWALELLWAAAAVDAVEIAETVSYLTGMERSVPLRTDGDHWTPEFVVCCRGEGCGDEETYGCVGVGWCDYCEGQRNDYFAGVVAEEIEQIGWLLGLSVQRTWSALTGLVVAA